MSVVTVTEESIIEKYSPEVVKIYKLLREHIFSIDNREIPSINIKNQYISFKVLGYNFVEIHLQKKGIGLHLYKEGYNDSRNFIETVPEKHKWTLRSRFKLKREEDINYVLDIIHQSYKKIYDTKVSHQ